jgi:uncharacterized protein YoxC
MNTSDPLFWMTIMTFIIAISFVTIAVAMIYIAYKIGSIVKTADRIEERVEPVIEKVTALGEQGRLIAVQGNAIAEQVTQISGYLSTATMHISESTALVKEEMRELKQLVGYSASTAREKVDLISRSVDQTQQQLTATAAFINSKVIGPAREFAAITAGLRRGLEVLLAPSPKPVNQSYGEDEMFIG